MNINISVPTKHQVAVFASHATVAACAAISALAFAGVLDTAQVKDATTDVNRIVADLKDLYGAVAGLAVIAMAVYSTVKSGPIGSLVRAALAINSDPKLSEKLAAAPVAQLAAVVAITDKLPDVAAVQTMATDTGLVLAASVPSRTVTVARALLLAFLPLALLAMAHPAYAQSRKPKGFFPAPVVSSLNALADMVTKDGQDAIALSTQIPELQDYVAQSCLTNIALIGKIVTAHPLKTDIEFISDMEAARLTGMALNKVCQNPNCGAMWNDVQNVVTAVNPSVIPVSLPSICSKVPVVTTLAASALPAAPAQPAPAPASGGSAAPAEPPAPAPSPAPAK